MRYHIKAALNKSHSIEAFKQNLNRIANRAEFSNATRVLIREIEQNLPKSGEGGGANTASEIKALDSQSEAPVKVIDQAQAVKAQEPLLARETESQTLPTKTKLERDLAPQEIHEVISKWDLSATSNKSGKQRLIVARVEAKEAEELTKAFKFKGQKNLIREIDSHQVIHALKQHGDMATEAQRGQIAINLEDISHYTDTIKEANFKHIQDNGRVLYAKQVNGHVVVIEEALSGQDKLRFFDMWKQKGKLNKEVLLSHSQRPNTTPSLNLEGHMPSNIATPRTPSSKGYDLDRTLSRGYQLDTTTPPLKSQDFKAKATELYNTAKAQEVEFKEFLENLKSANNSLELGQILKSEASIESKIARKAGDISDISDYLRAAIISKDKAHLDTELVRLEDSLKLRGIKPTIEFQHRNASGYKGVHIQFEFNGVPSEIQIHTAKNWGIKKQMDSIYHVLREQGIRQTLKDEEIEELKRKSKALAQGIDLDISDLTSFKVNSPVKGSEKSVLVRKSSIDLKGDQNPPLKSYSNRAPYDADIAYNRPESLLNQKESLEGGKGNTDKPLLSSIQATTSPLKSQEPKLLTYKPTSEIYKEAKAKGLSYAEFKAFKEQNKRLYLENTTIPKSTAEVIKEAKALGLKADEAIKAIRQNQKASLAGLKENERPLEIGQAIPMQKLNGYSSSISLDDTHIYPLDLVVVKTTDVKPNMQAKSGVQTRTQTDLNKVAEIANNFKPEYVINRGGFDDLPIIIQDGQVIVGNHRALGMQEFSPDSRKAYEQAIENTYGLKLKEDELLVRTPKETLTDKELINLASASNKERTTTFGDRLIAAIGKYDEYITPQNLKVLSLESSDVEESALRVAKMLDKQAKAPDIEATNLALLAHSARNNRTSLSEALDFAQKHLDQLEFTRLKDMFVLFMAFCTIKGLSKRIKTS
ncbi:hypothetical protein [Helicobacter suis]|uniref:PBECR3 domain-containing polyvalent protein n=1 Tax=Helicobacter suis TaxID=104628 RepID=UPI0013D07360|nr:hypothetical protein [Helicobacter suis]